jgi:hypothetical protein
MPCKCEFLHDIDIYGKEPEIYFKGRSQKTSWIGRIFTIIYVIAYIGFFSYEISRLIMKSDITFSESYQFKGEPPSMKVTNEELYGGFALEDPKTLETYVDESIYYTRAYFRVGKKVEQVWTWQEKELQVEVCQLEKFGSLYREVFKDVRLHRFYCIKKIDEILEGHLTYDVYSYIYLSFFPCVNTTNNSRICKPKEVINRYLRRTFLTLRLQDIEMTPQDYNKPIQARKKDATFTIGKNLFPNIEFDFNIVDIETDEDYLGFALFNKVKYDKHLKLASTTVLYNMNENDIFTTGEAICNITIQLADSILTQVRTYPKFIQILGDVGGVMEVVFSLFKIVTSFLINTLYEKSIVNHLFTFDIDKKIIILKKDEVKKKVKLNKNPKENNGQPKKYNSAITLTKISTHQSLYKDEVSERSINEDNLNKNDLGSDEGPKMTTSRKFLSKIPSSNSSFNDEVISIQSRNESNENSITKSKFNNQHLLLSKNLSKRKNKSKYKVKSSFSSNLAKYERNNIKNKNNLIKRNKQKILSNFHNIKIYDLNNNDNNSSFRENESIKKKVLLQRKKTIINKIKVNRCYLYLCFLCVRKKKNVQNILLDEAIRIIVKRLDILNIFKKVFRDEKIHKLFEKQEIIEMSYESRKNLENI